MHREGSLLPGLLCLILASPDHSGTRGEEAPGGLLTSLLNYWRPATP